MVKTLTTLDGETTTLDSAQIEDLERRLRGPLVGPDEDSYEESREVYNGMIDKRPGLVAHCTDAADVITCVDFARENGVLLAVRGGGHNGPGLGTCDGGLVADLAEIGTVRVDPDARTARVGGGCTWGDVDHATHAFGLATPSGFISTTGVGGLTLGGGFGYLSRKYGLTIDNLREADVVLADGSFVTASAEENEDLFWALRGGGGNFGVVTSFLFELHPVSTVVAGPTLWRLDEAPEVLRWYRDFIAEAPEELNGWFGFMEVPPSPLFPEKIHHEKVCGIVWCHTGPATRAEEDFRPVRQVGEPLIHGVQEIPYPVLQSLFDDLYPAGLQWYWKADFVRDLPEEAIEVHMEYAEVPTMHSTMHLYPINGAVHRVDEGETAWSYRDVTWGMVIAGVDPDPGNVDRITEWSRSYWEAMHRYSAGGAYINMMMEEGDDRIRASYRDNYERLVEVKRAYDPTNLFRVNQNIPPRPAGE